MSLLRKLRNLALLVIFTAAGFSLAPRTMAAIGLCEGHWCPGWCYQGRCCFWIGRKPCNSSAQCCGQACIDHMCQ
jgi:hypothetical protein